MEPLVGTRQRFFACMIGAGRSLRAAALLFAAIGLSGCQDKHEWHQKLTVVVDTPSGEVSGSSVVEVTATFGQLPMTDREVWYSLRGEATVVEVAPGRYLFALLGDSNERYYRAVRDQFENMDRGDWLKRIPDAKGVVTLEPKIYPLLVTFRDVDNPKTVRKVDPADISAVLGTGNRLERITLEITDAAITNGKVVQILNWLRDPGVMENPGWSSLPSEARKAIGKLLSRYPDLNG